MLHTRDKLKKDIHTSLVYPTKSSKTTSRPTSKTTSRPVSRPISRSISRSIVRPVSILKFSSILKSKPMYSSKKKKINKRSPSFYIF